MNCVRNFVTIVVENLRSALPIRRVRALASARPLLAIVSTAAAVIALGVTLLAVDEVANNFLANFAPELISVGLSALLTVFIVERALSAHEKGRWKSPRRIFLREARNQVLMTVIMAEATMAEVDQVVHHHKTQLRPCADFWSDFPDFAEEASRPTRALLVDVCLRAVNLFEELGSDLNDLRMQNSLLLERDPGLYSLFQAAQGFSNGAGLNQRLLQYAQDILRLDEESAWSPPPNQQASDEAILRCLRRVVDKVYEALQAADQLAEFLSGPAYDGDREVLSQQRTG